MARRLRPKQVTVMPKIRVVFEPHRLAQNCLERAYARVVPVSRRRVPTPPRPGAEPVDTTAIERQHGGGRP